MLNPFSDFVETVTLQNCRTADCGIWEVLEFWEALDFWDLAAVIFGFLLVGSSPIGVAVRDIVITVRSVVFERFSRR